MIERVTSKVLPGIVTHVIVKIAEPTSGKSKRQDFCDPANPLQVAEIPLPKGYKMAPHRHDVKKLAIHDAKAQECWIVKKGSIRVILYDLDDTKIKSEILKCGDFLVTLGGGHGMDT